MSTPQRWSERTLQITYFLLCAYAQLFQVGFLLAISGSLSAIAADLQATTAQFIWLPNSIVLVQAVLSPGMGRISDSYGRRWMMIGSCMFGIAGTATIATATSIEVAIGGCVLASPGYMASSLTYAIPSEIVSREKRPLVQGILSVSASLGGLLGLAGSGAFIKYSSWRHIYWVMCGGFASTGVLFAVFYHPPKRAVISSKSGTFDLIGNALLAIGLSLFLIALTWGGAPYSWTSPHVLALLIPGAIALLAMFAYEWKGRTDGIAHHDLFKDRNFPLALAAIAAEGWIFTCILGWMSQSIVVLWESDPLKANLRYYCFLACGLVSSPIIGLIVSRTKRVRELLVFGYLLFLGGVIGFSQSTPTMANLSFLFILLTGFGFAFPLLLLVVLAQLSVPGQLVGTSTTFVFCVRNAAGAVGNAVFTAIFSAKFTKFLPAAIAEATIPLGLPPASVGPAIGAIATGDVATLASLPGVTPAIIQAGFGAFKEAFAHALSFGWYSIMPIVALSILSTLAIRPIDQQMTDKVDAPVHAEDESSESQAEKGSTDMIERV